MFIDMIYSKLRSTHWLCRNLNGSTQQNSYLTYYVLDSYNPSKCAAYCDKVDLCTAFNICE